MKRVADTSWRGIVGTDDPLDDDDDAPANGNANAFGAGGLNGEDFPVVGDVDVVGTAPPPLSNPQIPLTPWVLLTIVGYSIRRHLTSQAFSQARTRPIGGSA